MQRVVIDMVLVADIDLWRTWRENRSTWEQVLHIARSLGWNAKGSIPVVEWSWDVHVPPNGGKWDEPRGPWSGDYSSGHVIRSDAVALARALQSHLATLTPLPSPPTRKEWERWRTPRRGLLERAREKLGKKTRSWEMIDWGKVDWTTHRNHQRLDRFIRFCRESGGFQIFVHQSDLTSSS